MVSIFALCSDNLSSNPAGYSNFLLGKIIKKQASVGLSLKKKKKRNGILPILSKPLVTQVDNNDDDDDDVTNVLILPKKSLWLFPQKIDSVWAKTNDFFKCRNCS